MSDSGRIGVDVGGTFTDIVTVVDDELTMTKVPSTPSAPEKGVFHGVESTDNPATAIDSFSHGTTVATNAVLERSWADTALVTTEGFRDVLEIARQERPDLYDLTTEKPTPIVPRDRRFEVAERLDERGDIIRPLDDSTVESTVAQVVDADVDSVALCLLFSYENDDHERQLAQALRDKAPSLAISRSSAIHPEIREYERTLATSLNAALKPVMDRYLERLEGGLQEKNADTALRIMQSNGGSIGSSVARDRPINTVLSGPAAGVKGAAHIASLAGYENAITMDMGGTSCDVSVITDGEPVISTEVDVGGYPISLPMVDIHTIGAGGGSIAWLDDGGALRVGPRSAGADPGPICYGRGGTEPTVTDAHVELGRIDPVEILDTEAPTSAVTEKIERSLAQPLDSDGHSIAAGIVAIANANMERAIRVMTVERGLDPREFALVAFGGAGPLHAASIARSLEIPTVLVPRAAGVLSAFGLVIADHGREFSTSFVRQWSTVDSSTLTDQFESFAEQGKSALRDDGVAAAAIDIERSLELRYRGQSFTLRIPVDGEFDEETKQAVARRFHERHEQRYGHASPNEPLELVTVRLRVRGRVSPPNIEMAGSSAGSSATPRTKRSVHFGDDDRETAIYDREALGPGDRLDGPALVEGAESTVLIPPEQRARLDQYGTISINTAGDAE